MNESGDNFFSCTRFARQEDGRIGGRDLRRFLQDVLLLRGFADHAGAGHRIDEVSDWRAVGRLKGREGEARAHEQASPD